MQMNPTLLYLCGVITRLTDAHDVSHIVLLAFLQVQMQIAILRLVHYQESDATPLYQRWLATQDRHLKLSNPISGRLANPQLTSPHDTHAASLFVLGVLSPSPKPENNQIVI